MGINRYKSKLINSHVLDYYSMITDMVIEMCTFPLDYSIFFDYNKQLYMCVCVSLCICVNRNVYYYFWISIVVLGSSDCFAAWIFMWNLRLILVIHLLMHMNKAPNINSFINNFVIYIPNTPKSIPS